MQVLIVEDHGLVRHGLRMMLDETKRFDSCFECVTLGDGIARAKELGPTLGLVILDLGLPDAEGLDGLDAMRSVIPNVPIVIVSGDKDTAIIDAAFSRGARGFVPKNSSAPALRLAIETVLAGELYVPPHVLPSRGAVSSLPPPVLAVTRSAASAAISSSAADALTPRQRDVLRLLARGLANKEIAEQLGMSLSTVRVHVTALFKTLGVENRTQAALSDAAQSITRTE